ncbi:MAG: hypothetical protein QOD06_2275 [Candidatus Binatota bacterium]|nr:hypothetical protein [Candidatus Binatota bacterium]
MWSSGVWGESWDRNVSQRKDGRLAAATPARGLA